MKRMWWWTAVLAVILLIGMGGTAKADEDSGRYGDTQIVWTFERESGTLRISGKGEMRQQTQSGYYIDAPWEELGNQVKKIEIQGTITSIVQYAFHSFHALSQVTLPDSLITIGADAFSYCENLEAVLLPSSLKTIGDRAFTGSGLTAVEIPSSVKTIGESAFEECEKLKTVVIKDGISAGIGDRAFNSCWQLKNLTIGEGVSSIGEGAFVWCDSLTSLMLPGSVKTIGTEAFQQCRKLKTVVFSSGLQTIESGAFEGCAALEAAVLPGTVTSIGYRAFFSCTGLKNAATGNRARTIGSYAFANCYSLETLSLGTSLELIDGYAFEKARSLKTVTVPASVKEIGENAFIDCSAMTKLVLKEGLESIGGSAFLGCSSLTALSLPDSVTSLDSSAFQRCGSLKTVRLGSGISQLSSYVFYGCSSVETITIPGNVAWIGEKALGEMSSLKQISVNAANAEYKAAAGVLFTKDGRTLLQYPCGRTDSSYAVPAGTSRIEAEAFSDNVHLTGVSFPASLRSIGAGAFTGCENLKNLWIPAGVESIENGAFNDCPALENIGVDAGNSVFSVKDGALYEAGSGRYIQYPPARQGSSLTLTGKVIARGAFAHARYLTSVSIGGFEIGDQAFYDCSQLKTAEIRENVHTIGGGVFEECPRLESITVNSMNQSFSSVSGVLFDKDRETLLLYPAAKADESYTIPGGVYNVKNFAFDHCSKLKKLIISKDVDSFGNFDSSGSALESFEVKSGNTSFCAVSGVLFNAAKTTLVHYPPRKAGTGYTVPASVLTVDYEAFSGCRKLKTVTLPDGLLMIRAGAFLNCSELTSLTIPETVSRVGSIATSAFSGCSSLEELCYRGDRGLWYNALDGQNPDLTGMSTVIRFQPKAEILHVSGTTAKAVGEQAVFSVCVKGSGLKYRWQYRYPNGAWTDSGFNSAKTAALSFTAAAKYHRLAYRCLVTDAYGNSVISPEAWLTIRSEIVSHPEDLGTSAGSTAVFQVKATGAGLKYQWQYRYPDGEWENSGYNSARTARLSFAVPVKYNNMEYRCIVTDTDDNVLVSATAKLTVLPEITAQPENVSVKVKGTAKFSVKATGAGLKYRWQYKAVGGNWTDSGYSSARTATLSFMAPAKNNGMQYRCIITDANGKKLTSAAAKLTILPEITAQPENVSVKVKETAKFSVKATGAGLKYQWQYKAAGGEWTDSGYSSARTANLSFMAPAKNNNMQYRCIITDANGKELTSAAVRLTILPEITAQPEDVSVKVKETAEFSVKATGAGLKYQWQYKAADGEWTNSGYSSARTAALSFMAPAKNNGMRYRCIITDANGKKIISEAALLTVEP